MFALSSKPPLPVRSSLSAWQPVIVARALCLCVMRDGGHTARPVSLCCRSSLTEAKAIVRLSQGVCHFYPALLWSRWVSKAILLASCGAKCEIYSSSVDLPVSHSLPTCSLICLWTIMHPDIKKDWIDEHLQPFLCLWSPFVPPAPLINTWQGSYRWVAHFVFVWDHFFSKTGSCRTFFCP